MAKILALDYGQRKIGVAVGDTDDGFAFIRPAILLGSDDAIWPALQALLQAEQPATVVIGLPKNADGTEGAQAKAVRAFADEAEEKFGIQTQLWDERNTSQAVQREQLGRSLPRGAEDSLAAQLILEGFLHQRT